MTPAGDKPEKDSAQPPPAPKKYYLLVGKTSIKGPFTAEQLREHPDFNAASTLAPLGATKASHWKPADHFEELRAILAARNAAADDAKLAAEAPKAAPPAKPPTGHH